MGEYARIEIAVGFFVILCMLALAYLSVSLGGASLWPTDRYTVKARFASVGDLSEGAIVKLAGVPVGEVRSIGLDNYAAGVEMRIDRSLALPADTIASIKTSGLLGEAYVALSPGASEDDIADGGRISQTEPPIDLFELVERYAFDDDLADDDPPAPGSSKGDEQDKPSPFPDPLE